MEKQFDIVIFVNEINNRIAYVLEFIFNNLGLKSYITSNKKEYNSLNCSKINYSKGKFSDEFFINAHGILNEKGINKQEIKSDFYRGLPVIFSDAENPDFPFDIFSAIFYMITRYEEYLQFKADEHGRFRPQDSIAFKYNFLDVPIVERWIDVFKDVLKAKFPNLNFKENQFTYIPTIDIDNAFSYKNKGIVLCSALIIRDIIMRRYGELKNRLNVIIGLQKDPFDNFDFLYDTLKSSKYEPVFFFQTGKRGTYDKNTSIKKKAMKNLVKKMSGIADIGIHPSYQSNTSVNILIREKNDLENVLGNAVTKSRQHYLILEFPATYNNLIKAGIKEDFSLGYASTPGFRAGTCTPFYFYDLTNEVETSLKVIPFQLMDATFKSYLHFKPEKAGSIMINYYEKVKRAKGTLVIIWHNDSFALTPEGEKWRELFKRIIEL